MRPSRRQVADLQAEIARLTAHDARLGEEVGIHAQESASLAGRLTRPNDDLTRMKETVASHLAATRHPSTVLHTVDAFTEALQQALKDAGLDLSLDVYRMKGIVLWARSTPRWAAWSQRPGSGW